MGTSFRPPRQAVASVRVQVRFSIAHRFVIFFKRRQRKWTRNPKWANATGVLQTREYSYIHHIPLLAVACSRVPDQLNVLLPRNVAEDKSSGSCH